MGMNLESQSIELDFKALRLYEPQKSMQGEEKMCRLEYRASPSWPGRLKRAKNVVRMEQPVREKD